MKIMINFFLLQILNGLDWVYINYLSGFFSKITELLTMFENSRTLFDEIIGIIYFFCGKNLIVFGIGVGVTIIIVKIVFAIINLVGQFVP